MQDRDLRVVCNAIQSLREICNEIVEPRSPGSGSGSGSGRWLPDWCYLDKRQPAQWSNIQHYRPLDNISLDQINLVFLSQEMTTTGGDLLYWLMVSQTPNSILCYGVLKLHPKY